MKKIYKLSFMNSKYIKYHQTFLQFFLLFFVVSAYAESSCLELVKKLEKERSVIELNDGMWGYFEKSSELRERSVDAIQLDSRINKIFFLLTHLCETEKGIPLNDLATYISRNLSKKGKSEFISELLLIGKTPQQVDTWFAFYQFSLNHKSRILTFSKIRNALDLSAPIIDRYVNLAEDISRGGSAKEILIKTQALNITIDKLLSLQPYLSQALAETSHIPYWDTNESSGGS